MIATAAVGPLHFLAGAVLANVEPAGAAIDELLRTGCTLLQAPKLTAAVRSRDRHVLACALAARRRDVGVLVLAAQCATCARPAWQSVANFAPAYLSPVLQAASPTPPWASLLVDVRYLQARRLFERVGGAAALWELVTALGAAWRNAAAVLEGVTPAIRVLPQRTETTD